MSPVAKLALSFLLLLGACTSQSHTVDGGPALCPGMREGEVLSCERPPPGCTIVGAGPCSCGTCVWSDAGTDGSIDTCPPDAAIPSCAAPPAGCNWVGGTRCSCGTLECECDTVPNCAPVPPGCRVENPTRCGCGTVVCDCGPDSPPIDCAAPPPGCVWEGRTRCACGELSCDDGCDPNGPVIDCAAPPEGCHYEGLTRCSCGQLVCDECPPDVQIDCPRPPQFCQWANGTRCSCGDLVCASDDAGPGGPTCGQAGQPCCIGAMGEYACSSNALHCIGRLAGQPPRCEYLPD